MATYDGVIEGTAREVMLQLSRMQPDEHVRLMIGRPSLSAIARRLQTTAAANGMTSDSHDELMKTLKHDG